MTNDTELQTDMQAEVSRGMSLDLARSAINALGGNVLVPAADLTVFISNGWLTLEGTVDRNCERNAAEDAVRNLRGVKGITNIIQIRPGLNAGNISS